MSAFVSAHPPLRMARLEKAETIQDVVRNVDQIIGWSINAESHLGYFAVVYKRVTLAIRKAINEGVFDDRRRVEELDVVFAQRYFNALNAYFYPDEHQGPTLPWDVAFVGDQERQAIILQHLIEDAELIRYQPTGPAQLRRQPLHHVNHAGDLGAEYGVDPVEIVIQRVKRVRRNREARHA